LVLDGVMAAPVAVKRSPFNNADVCVRVLFARFRGLSPMIVDFHPELRRLGG
jgi:hypothetical protein